MSQSQSKSYDLHAHSHFSDGDLAPNELVQAAAERGITHLSLTDHDTTAGLGQAQTAALEHGINLINGIELSCQWNGQLLHVLGLNINPSSDALNEGIKHNHGLRNQRAEAMHNDFLAHGLDLREEVSAQVGDTGVPTRPHFAEALIRQGIVKDKKTAFKRYLVKGKVGFIPMQWPDIADAARWINAADGVAVLAHPTRYKFTRSKLVRLVEHMKTLDMHALEVSTPITTLSQRQQLGQLCLQYDLFASRGSDFHSVTQPWAPLGGAAELDQQLRPVWSLF